MSAVTSAAELVAFPVGATVIGSTVAAVRPPGPKTASAVQHFAAGVVFAAVAGEVLPQLRREHSLGFLVAGFALGVAVVLVLGSVERRAQGAMKGEHGVPVGLLGAIGVDLFIDGLIIGIGASLGEGQGRVLTIALTLEVLFLGLSLATELRSRGVSRRLAAGIPAGISLCIVIGALGGAATLAHASHAVLAAVLAFGAAALLYLVTEELLVEAHEGTETALLTTMFFIGFLALYVLEGLNY